MLDELKGLTEIHGVDLPSGVLKAAKQDLRRGAVPGNVVKQLKAIMLSIKKNKSAGGSKYRRKEIHYRVEHSRKHDPPDRGR